MDESQFYTGIVADLYDVLVPRDEHGEIAFYSRMIRDGGEPALELGCGSGRLLLELLEEGLEVEGADSSHDMLDRCRKKAEQRGLSITLHHQEMQSLELRKRYQTIFVASSSFMLVTDLGDVRRALRAILRHLLPGGRAAIGLHQPQGMPDSHPLAPSDEWRVGREGVRAADGASVRCLGKTHYDLDHQLQLSILRYEVIAQGEILRAEERPFSLRWHTQPQFHDLLADAGFAGVRAVRGTLEPSKPHDPVFVFIGQRVP